MHLRGGSGHARRRTGLLRGAWVLALTSGVFAGAFAFGPSVRSTTDASRPTVRVRRADLDAVVVAAGRAESARSTEIRCELERLTTGTGATILTLVEDGTDVKKGDVLCRIDAADYEELVRRQTITVDQARAAFRQAELELDVARMAVNAYRQGDMAQTDKLFRGQIALARSDLTRQSDRLEWSRQMSLKGYLGVGQVMTEDLTLRRAILSLKQSETAYRNFQRFTVPITLRSYESQVIAAGATLDFQTIKLKREEERLALYTSMVERCTVRAPHDGFVVHANRPGRSPEVYEGAPVRQRMRLFDLPDLSEMVVVALLHETVVNQVREGMPVRARIEALPGEWLEGVVASVAPMPYTDRKAESGSDISYYLGRVKLTRPLPGLRPGMSAELEILVERRPGVLAVPPDAVVSAGGRDVCLVPRGGLPETRPVTLGRASHDLVEVLSGLSEGESVLVRAPKTPGSTRRAAVNDFGGPWDLKKFPPPAPPEKRVRAPRPPGVGGGGGPGGQRRRGGGGPFGDMPPGF